MENDFGPEEFDIDSKTGLKESIGARFRKMREYTGLSQKETGLIFDMNQSNIARIEKGIVSPNMAICDYFRTHYNINMNWLITGEGDMVSDEDEMIELGVDYGEFKDEMKDLQFHLDNVPNTRFDILKFFLSYKLENKKSILQFLKENNISKR